MKQKYEKKHQIRRDFCNVPKMENMKLRGYSDREKKKNDGAKKMKNYRVPDCPLKSHTEPKVTLHPQKLFCIRAHERKILLCCRRNAQDLPFFGGVCGEGHNQNDERAKRAGCRA